MKLTRSGKLIFMLLTIMALLVAWGSGSGGYVARDIFPAVQVVFGNMSGAYAEAVRRTHVFDTFEPDKHFYTYLLPEHLGMSDEAFLARKDLLKIVKYHILVGPVADEPLADDEDPYDRLHRGESVEVRTLLGPTVTLTPRGLTCCGFLAQAGD